MADVKISDITTGPTPVVSTGYLELETIGGVSKKNTIADVVLSGSTCKVGTNSTDVQALGTATGGKSTAYGSGTAASKANATALGEGATASNTQATAIGPGAVASATESIAMGDTAAASKDNSIAIGYLSTASNDNAMALGVVATASGNGATAVGVLSSASGTSSVALGILADASTTSAVAIGNSAKASASGAVAIGSAAVANVANTVSVGASGTERKIVNVVDGVAATDAATVNNANSVGPIAIYTGTQAVGIPGNPHFVPSPSVFAGQRVHGAPFIVRRRIKVTGLIFKAGGTVSSSPTYSFGLYAWDPATGKPTTLLASTSQASPSVTTIYDKTFGSPVTLEPGIYFIACLSNTTGTQSLHFFPNLYAMEDSLTSYSGNNWLHPCAFSGPSGVVALPSPNAGAFTQQSDYNMGAVNDAYGLTYPCLLKYEAP